MMHAVYPRPIAAQRCLSKCRVEPLTIRTDYLGVGIDCGDCGGGVAPVGSHQCATHPVVWWTARQLGRCPVRKKAAYRHARVYKHRRKPATDGSESPTRRP